MSTWTKSKQEEEEEIGEGKGNLFCLARGQIEQSKVLLILQVMTFGTSDCDKTNLCGEGWPNLQCHKLVLSTSDVQEFVGKYRPQLIELTRWLDLLWIKLVKINKHQYHIKIM